MIKRYDLGFFIHDSYRVFVEYDDLSNILFITYVLRLLMKIDIHLWKWNPNIVLI